MRVWMPCMGTMLVGPMQNLKLSRWQPKSQHAYNTDSNLFFVYASVQCSREDNGIGQFHWTCLFLLFVWRWRASITSSHPPMWRHRHCYNQMSGENVLVTHCFIGWLEVLNLTVYELKADCCPGLADKPWLKYSWLICCDRKILFDGWKGTLISPANKVCIC